MKKGYLPYYLTRAIISILFSALVFGLSWVAGVFAAVLFGLFLLYLHSGWFDVNPATPFTPLRRDPRAREIQRKALIAALVCGTTLFVISPYLSNWFLNAETRPIVLPIGIIVYFGVQFFLLSRT
ncbi:MAG TPA: hypothetical protein ENG59_05155 [Chloroflexi bacterium]|nr:MAG: hypothetical protein DRI46_03190 [Chloroflexota bacterium]HDD55608.1 hypothetical protein [Chloroflexota bacterium]